MKEKVIGILGGMGPEATLLMFEKILLNTSASRDQEHARVIIDNNPKIPERLPAILGVGESAVPMMVKSGLALERAGADFIVIPCVTAHFFLPDLRQQLNLPILSIVDETAVLIEKQKPKISEIGLLAAEGSIRGGLFQERLLKSGTETLVPEDSDLQELMKVIFQIKDTKGGHSRKALRERTVKIADRLIQKGAQGMIVSCTEISLILDSHALLVPIFDALTILARAAIRKASLKPINTP